MGMREIDIGGGRTLTIYELEDVYDSVTGCTLTGSWIWDSAIVLSQWMSTQAEQLCYDFANKTVLELGAGTGLPGLTAARLGASCVILTDINQLIPALEKNVEVNGLGDRVKACQLEWGLGELPNQLSELDHVDLVLLSDVIIDAAEMPGLAKTLKKICGQETIVWGASEVRPWTSDAFNELEKEGFRIVEFLSQPSSGRLPEEASELFSVFQLVPAHHHQVQDEHSDLEESWSPIV